MKIKAFVRYDDDMRMVRLGRIVWQRGAVGDGNGYSAKVSLALWPKLFRLERGFHEVSVTVLGVRLHFAKSYGGVFA